MAMAGMLEPSCKGKWLASKGGEPSCKGKQLESEGSEPSCKGKQLESTQLQRQALASKDGEHSRMFWPLTYAAAAL
jgi:hypothetical protein